MNLKPKLCPDKPFFLPPFFLNTAAGPQKKYVVDIHVPGSVMMGNAFLSAGFVMVLGTA